MLQHTLFLHASQTECMYHRFPRGAGGMRLCDGAQLRLVALLMYYSSAGFACVTHPLHSKSAALTENMVWKKCKQIAPIPESSSPSSRRLTQFSLQGRMDQATKKKKGDATSKRGLRVKDRTFFFFFKSRFQAQTLNAACSGTQLWVYSISFHGDLARVKESHLRHTGNSGLRLNRRPLNHVSRFAVKTPPTRTASICFTRKN